MTLVGYRVAKRTEPDLAASWGLWSDDRQRWLDVIYATEREATDMLAHLIAGERPTTTRETLMYGKAYASWVKAGMDMWMLGAEAGTVMALRMTRIASGESAGATEAELMVTEKVHAASEL